MVGLAGSPVACSGAYPGHADEENVTGVRANAARIAAPSGNRSAGFGAIARSITLISAPGTHGSTGNGSSCIRTIAARLGDPVSGNRGGRPLSSA